MTTTAQTKAIINKNLSLAMFGSRRKVNRMLPWVKYLDSDDMDFTKYYMFECSRYTGYKQLVKIHRNFKGIEHMALVTTDPMFCLFDNKLHWFKRHFKKSLILFYDLSSDRFYHLKQIKYVAGGQRTYTYSILYTFTGVKFYNSLQEAISAHEDLPF